MKYDVANFKGMLPILGNAKLPDGFASSAINTKLVSGDIEGYLDLANPFQLAKAAPILTLEKADNGDWLQFMVSEKASFAFDIRAIPGIIPGDTTGRRYITGYSAFSGVPQFTNTFYATDPSQQGLNLLGAYPYVTFPLGIADPASGAKDPAASAPAAAGTSTNYDFAQESSVNNATVVAAGTGFSVGDKPFIVGGTLAPGFVQATGAAQMLVTSVSPAGAITGVTLLTGGFYRNNAGPGSTTINQVGLTLPAATITVASTAGAPATGSFTVVGGTTNQTVSYTGISGNNFTGCTGGAGAVTNGVAVQIGSATVALTGGTGTGATVAVTNQGNNFNGFGQFQTNNSAGFYSIWSIANNHWSVATGQGDLTVSYSNTAFGLKTAQMFTFQADMQTDDNGGGEYTDLIMWLSGTYNGTNAITGPGVILSKTDSTFGLYTGFTGTNGSAVTGSLIQQSTVAVTGNTMYRVKAVATQQTASTTPGFSVIVTLALQSSPSSIIATLTGFIPYSGENLGVGTNHRGGHNNGNTGEFENLFVQVSQPASELTVESTNYVYTYVQNIPGDPLTQESGPSNPSATIDVDIDGTTNPPTRATATIVIPPSPSGEYITYYNLYRLVADAQGNETYTFVTELAAFTMSGVVGSYTVGEPVTTAAPPTGSGAKATVLAFSGGVLQLSGVSGVFKVGETITGGSSGATGTFASSALPTTTITYHDSAQDNAIGPGVLISQNWAPPPANMQGIIAFPNGIMGGFAGNIFCLSAQNFPHAWPVENQYATDTPITSATPIDTTGLLTTKSYPYTAWGTDPSAFSMSKEVSIQGCTSTRGVATHKRFGVIFPSGNGLCYYRGQGQLDLIRVGPFLQPPFSYEQWQALGPSSIKGEVHDDYYFFWYDNGVTKSGYVIDFGERGFGLHALDVHVTESYIQKDTDLMWLVPDFSVYPVNGSVVSAALNVVSQWEGAATYRPRHWERDEILYGREVAFQKARVQSSSTGTVNLSASSEQGSAYNGTVTQQRAFTVAPQPGFRWNVALDMTGAVRINTAALAEAVEELTV